MLAFWGGVALYLAGAAADAYTTKRALRDPYHGRRLPLREGNGLAAWLFRKIGFWPAVLLTKGGVLALLLVLARADVKVATFLVWVLATAQLFLGYRNRRKIMQARSRIPLSIILVIGSSMLPPMAWGFAAWLLFSPTPAPASWLTTQEWSWDEVTQNALGDPIFVPAYRIYQSQYPDCFLVGDYVEVSAMLACDDVTCDPPRCCADPPEPSETTYYYFVAVSAAGVESVWPETIRKELTCP